MSRELENPRRLIDGADDAREEKLAQHLRQIDAPPALSPAALARIRLRAQAPATGRHWRWLAPALAAAGIVLWMARRPGPVTTPPQTIAMTTSAPTTPTTPTAPTTPTTPTTPTAPATPIAQAQAAAVEPPAPPHLRPAPVQRLQEGPLIVRAGNQPAFVDVPGGRVQVASHGVARIEVHGYSVRIAAYRGAVSVTSATESFVVEPGADTTRVLTAEPAAAEPATADGAEAELIARALRLLRVDHDPAAALKILDEHDRRFPTGPLDREVARLRQEAASR